MGQPARNEDIYEERRTTLWKNETQLRQRVELFTTHMHDVPGRMINGRQTEPHKCAKKIERVWEPGETIELPMEFDEAIQKVVGGTYDADIRRIVGGGIHGGAAPGLTNMSLKAHQRPKLHEPLDHDLQATLHANAMAAAASAQATTAADLAVLAAHRVNQQRIEAESKAAEARAASETPDPKGREMKPADRGGR